MTNRGFRLSQLVLALGVAGLLSAGVPLLSGWLVLEGGLVSEAQAQDTHGHSEGGETSHGHSEGSSGGKPPWAGTPGGKPAYMSGGATGGHTTGGHDTGGTTGGHDSGGTTGGHDSGGSSGHSGGGGPPPGKGPGGSGGGHDSGGSDSGSHASSGGHSGGSGGHSGGGGGKGKGKGGPQYGKKTHGSGEKHEGHVSGEHGSPHETGADRHFGGGSGLGGIGGVPEGVGHGRGAGRRYWGGWVIPDDDGDGIPTQYAEEDSDLSSYFNPGPGGGGASKAANLSGSYRCSDVDAKISLAQRLSKPNMERGHEAQRVLASDATSPEDEYREHMLLASFQEEMMKPSPDPTVAGTYLGLIAHTEVTPDLVKHVCFHMCVPAGDSKTRDQVASNAEVVRVAAQ